MAGAGDEVWHDLDDAATTFLHAARSATAEAMKLPNAGELVPKLFEAAVALTSVVTAGHRGTADKLRALDDAKSNQLRQATHELRRPVGVMNGHLSLILDGSFGHVADALLPSLHTMQQAVAQMQELLDLLAEAARLEDRAQILRKERTALGHLVRDAIRDVEAEAQARRVVIEQDVPTPDLIARVDPRHLRIALRNLIVNAVKFTKAGSQVLVKARAKEHGFSVSVADQGPGIAPDERQRIFERWHQGGDTMPGLGLGLAIANDIVALHGGQLQVDSQPGEGATFTMVIPG
jgi:NtrC-family two-component system sensor histidine kinase KinB